MNTLLRVAQFLIAILNASLLMAVEQQANPSEVTLPPDCDSVCGLRKTALHASIDEYIPEASLPDYAECVSNSDRSLRRWNNSARLFLKYMGIGDATIGCPKMTVDMESQFGMSTRLMLRGLKMGRFTDYSDFKDVKLTFPEERIRLQEPGDIPGYCDLFVNRAILSRKRDGGVIPNWISSLVVSTGDPPFTRFSMFAIVNSETNKVWSAKVANGSNDYCIPGDSCDSFQVFSLPASTFNTSVPYKVQEKPLEVIDFTPVYSMFTTWSGEQVPGMREMLSKLEGGVKAMENVDGDLSPSNIAILCLPLVMAVPPISLLELRSDATIAWYAFATDFLAALPLMIKGIELLVSYRFATPQMYTTLSMMGKHYGIFEQFDVQCFPPPAIEHTFGIVLIWVALWFMMASSYVEFVFWRSMRYREGALRTIEDLLENDLIECQPTNSPIPSMQHHNIVHSNPVTEVDKYCMRKISLLVLWLVLFGLFFWISLFNAFDVVMITFTVVNVAFAINLLLLRAVLLRRLYQFGRIWFVFGIVFGLICGPLYMALHLFRHVRHSKTWAEIADGANIGFACFSMMLSILWEWTFYRTRYLAPSFIFAWILTIAIASLHVIRSTKFDQVLWRYAINGFALGFLFGPVGVCFKRCFPEVGGTIEQARSNFFGGVAFGLLFLATFTVTLVSYFLNETQWTP